MDEKHYWINKDGDRHTEHMERMAFIIDEGCYRMRPCMMWKPKIYKDGNQWCALLGENIQIGVCGFGNTPAEAMKAFDKDWLEKEGK